MTSTRVPAEAAAALDRWLGGARWDSEAIAGDASTRQYFRIRSSDGSTSVLTFYPPDAREGLARFLKANAALSGRVPVPGVIASDEASVLQEDVGDVSLAALLERDREAAVSRYHEAVELIAEFDSVEAAGRRVNPPFDRAKFSDELDMTRTYYVESLAGMDSAALKPLFDALASRLAEHPYALCHRDYHGHNLYLFNGSLYVIDYQDMRLGPDTYDLASLLRDRGVFRTLGRELEGMFLATHAAARGETVERLRARYLEALLQRSIKAIGTFARLTVVYGRRQYLAYIEPTLETVRECAGELDEWRELHSLFPFEFKTP